MKNESLYMESLTAAMWSLGNAVVVSLYETVEI